MHDSPIKCALISVSNKEGIVPFARQLHERGITLISTGGTCSVLREANIPVTEVSELTGFPEIMDGRVKTLHPKVHAGILGKRTTHAGIAKTHSIDWIDLVVVNLYPFAETIKDPSTRFEDAIEQIDIGGPAMIRSAAKNMEFVTTVVDPADYDSVIQTLSTERGIDFAQRKALACKAFKHTADYDALIHAYLSDTTLDSQPNFPSSLCLKLTHHFDLRYGENPDQKACAYILYDSPNGLLNALIHQGKTLSYNNLVDADAALACVREFTSPACVIVKHANPCGIALADTIRDAFHKAWSADSISAFGGIVALNRSCDLETAKLISNTFFEVIIAPSYSAEALQLFSLKPNQRILEIANTQQNQAILPYHQWHYQAIEGGFLVQEKMMKTLDHSDLKCVTEQKPTDPELSTLLFAWLAVKHVKSNAIVIARDNQTIGIGAGQVSRIDAVDLAIRKASENLLGGVLASDAFFPFRDSIDSIAKTGIRAIIQPGGSIRDEEVIQACNEHGIAMVFTGTRCFRH